MKLIYSFGDFDQPTCSWARIRNTVAQGLDPALFKTYAYAPKRPTCSGFEPLKSCQNTMWGLFDKVTKGIKLPGILSHNLFTSWGEIVFPLTHVGMGTFSFLSSLKNLHVDLFHSASYPICVKILKMLRKRNPRMKLVHTFYGFHPFAVYRWAGYYLAREADVITCVSKNTARQVKRFIGKDSRVIYDGVDTDLFHPSTHENARPQVLFVGSFSITRRPEFLLRLAKDLPNCDIIVKTNPLAPKYRRLFQHAPPNIHFILRPMTHQELAPLYSHADIFFNPSVHEGFSNVMLEAAASGLPLVVSRATSFWEFVRDEQQGYRCATYNEMLDRVRFLAENPEARHRIGAHARKEAEKFCWDKIIPQYDAIFHELLL